MQKWPFVRKQKTVFRKKGHFQEFSSKFIVLLTAGWCIVSRKHEGHDFWNYFLLGQTIPMFILQHQEKKVLYGGCFLVFDSAKKQQLL